MARDSLTLPLRALPDFRRFYPKKFTLTAITVDLGYDSLILPHKQLCEELKVPYHIVKTEIARILFHGDSAVGQSSQGISGVRCAPKCAKGALNEAALELGCNKVAYAHHMDDVIETAFLSHGF